MMKAKKVALIHDWLNGMRGGERVLEIICDMFPDAEIFTLHLDRKRISKKILSHRIRTSRIQIYPFRRKLYRMYLPFFPRAIERFDLSEFDLVISTSHCVAKGAKSGAGTLHICYCFSPMRYAWQFYDEYFGGNPLKKLVLKPMLNRLKKWDFESCSRADEFVAISETVAGRIKDYYRREAAVIYPPVNTDFFAANESTKREDYFLVVSALVPYKRVDLAVRVFGKLGLPLKVVGTGPEMKRLKESAGSNVSFEGWLSDEEVREHYRRCRAFVFPGEEDFGLTPIEANACGAPVIAYRKGGVTESIADGRTGVFFDEQSEDSLADAVERFGRQEFSPAECREQSLKFDTRVFRREFEAFVERKYSEFYS